VNDEPATRNLTRRQRRRARAGAARSRPGGITACCGCRYARTGGWWYHVTPCRAHPLKEWPVTEEHLREAL
jgi:hypothetical protein